eukprot:gnl/TRDRNA2_/TRDRNA2_154845_c1_seq1.p2 gnl/TRDRNA2_/TRDRNA2_154845_c1~~gnl/TRDRNA2_/TRDRNA2_154845_c1_seq1.p2  ORF type:complete len:119 (+),score=18.45 gnl/TRDRNA2_/TRDRNA2_154845_c1_seq1:228-584(+)
MECEQRRWCESEVRLLKRLEDIAAGSSEEVSFRAATQGVAAMSCFKASKQSSHAPSQACSLHHEASCDAFMCIWCACWSGSAMSIMTRVLLEEAMAKHSFGTGMLKLRADLHIDTPKQ